ncbi:hypothetical protein TNCV_3351121 [Trichonephila clavipes]|nr:hypothetical protein TNCV_3351121 [Trichonephila clavipes]
MNTTKARTFHQGEFKSFLEDSDVEYEESVRQLNLGKNDQWQSSRLSTEFSDIYCIYSWTREHQQNDKYSLGRAE